MEAGRGFEHAGREDHEEVQVELAPIDLADARHAGLDRHALHVEHDFVADRRVQVLGEVFLQGKRRGGLGIGYFAYPGSGDDRLRGGEMVAIGGAEFTLQDPLGHVLLLFQVRARDAAHRLNAHGDDRRAFEHRELLQLNRREVDAETPAT